MKDSYKKVCEDLLDAEMTHATVFGMGFMYPVPLAWVQFIRRARALVKADKRKKRADGPR